VEGEAGFVEGRDAAAYTGTDLGRDDGCSSRDRRAVETRRVERVSWRSPGGYKGLLEGRRIFKNSCWQWAGYTDP
jgi:hypothetical protein